MISYEYYKINQGILVETDIATILNELLEDGETNILIKNIRIESGNMSLREDYTTVSGDTVNLKDIVPNTPEHILKGSTFSCGLDRDSLASSYMASHPELFIGEGKSFSLVGDGSGSIKNNNNNQIEYWTHGKCGTSNYWLPPCNPFPGQGSKHCPIASNFIPEEKYWYGIILQDYSHWYCPHAVYTPIFRNTVKYCISNIQKFSRYVVTNKNGYLCKEGSYTLPTKKPVWSEEVNNIVYDWDENGNDKKYYFNQPQPVTPGTLYINYNNYLVKVIFDYYGTNNNRTYYYWQDIIKTVFRELATQSKNYNITLWYELSEEYDYYFDMKDERMEIDEVYNSNLNYWERYTIHNNKLYFTDYPFENWNSVFGGVSGAMLEKCEYDADNIDMSNACMTLSQVNKKCACGISTVNCETLQQTVSIKEYEETADLPFTVWEE